MQFSFWWKHKYKGKILAHITKEWALSKIKALDKETSHKSCWDALQVKIHIYETKMLSKRRISTECSLSFFFLVNDKWFELQRLEFHLEFNFWSLAYVKWYYFCQWNSLLKVIQLFDEISWYNITCHLLYNKIHLRN